jgi:hypothetical protein
MISSITKGITCISSKEDLQISQRRKEFGLWYPKGKDLLLIAYTDVDWAGCIDDR